MRTRKEIENIENPDSRWEHEGMTYPEIVMLELLLDIRELLQKAKDTPTI